MAGQKIRERFRHFSSLQTDSMVNAAALTLREQLVKDIEDERAGRIKIVWGALYYQEKEMQFAGQQNELHELLRTVLPLEGIEASPELVKALRASQSRGDRSSFLELFASCERLINAAEVAGLFRWASDLKCGCLIQLGVAKQFLIFAKKWNLDREYAAHWKLLAPWADTVMQCLWRSARKNKPPESLATFVKCNRGILTLLLPAASLDAVMQAEEGADLDTHLAKLTGSYGIGRQLFQVEQQKVLGRQVSTAIQAAIDGYFQKPDITIGASDISDLHKALFAEINGIAGIEMLPAKRDTHPLYRGQKTTVKIESIGDEVNTHLAAAVRTVGVEKNMVTPMFVEGIVIPEGSKSTYVANVHADLLTDCIAARSRLAGIYSNAVVSSSAQIQALIMPKTPSLLLCDRDFKLELALISELTRVDEKARLRQATMQALPTVMDAVTPNASALRLQALQSSQCFKLSTEAAQKKHDIAMNVVAAIADDRVPDTRTMATDTCLQAVLARCAFFCRAVGQAEGGGDLVGAPALQALLDTAAAKFSKSCAKRSDIAPLKTFAWMYNDDQKVVAKQLIANIEKKLEAEKPDAAAASSCSQPSKDKAKSRQEAEKKEKKASLGLRKALSYFT